MSGMPEEVISRPETKIKVLVVPTDEERMIAQETQEVLQKQ
jgi:acetate kinase